jgi:hypothetical protein
MRAVCTAVFSDRPDDKTGSAWCHVNLIKKPSEVGCRNTCTIPELPPKQKPSGGLVVPTVGEEARNL